MFSAKDHPSPAQKEMLTPQEAAQLLNVQRSTIYRWIKQGILPAYKINTCWRLHHTDLLQLMAKCYVGPKKSERATQESG